MKSRQVAAIEASISQLVVEPNTSDSPDIEILKGQCHEIFDLYFFINPTHLGP